MLLNKICLQCMLFSVFFLYVLPAFSASNSLTGFLPNSIGAMPISKGYTGDRPAIEFENTRGITVIVYMHGTNNSNKAQDCSAPSSRVPDALKRITGANIVIFYLCSSAVETLSFIPGSYIFNRLNELEPILNEILTAGVDSSQIFLAGHSAGGWVALMAAHRFQEKYAGSIAFAPAFSGRKKTVSFWWRNIARPHQIRKMLSAEDIHALVFAYYNDPFEDPESLNFLTKKPSVKLISYNCPFPHSAIFRGCKLEDVRAEVHDFIKETQLKLGVVP
ncbi:serine aminopeptidase domain-containing protein [Alkalimonas amylolytica]|uniref:Alpha/beta hydrolase family protein n=1 Tax=Alkalimonas amylolytica TaxID=152573 RepID=A0A1H4EK52_ALKAM|nr:alpha/beta hydrolase [Alkalimonas amylolytica]SEA85229.1 Alpha/beta hydrolase family protein [Alkalimonas amylolytica]